MDKNYIVQKLQKLNFPKEDYWLVAGSAMVLYGVKAETGDIDLGCSRELADRLEADGYPVEHMADGCRRITVDSEVEVFEDWLFDCIEAVDGIPVISLKGLVIMKRSLGRGKDLSDIEAIKAFTERRL